MHTKKEKEEEEERKGKKAQLQGKSPIYKCRQKQRKTIVIQNKQNTVSWYTAITILNVNINRCVHVKRHRMFKQIKNQDPLISCLQEAHFNFQDT